MYKRQGAERTTGSYVPLDKRGKNDTLVNAVYWQGGLVNGVGHSYDLSAWDKYVTEYVGGTTRAYYHVRIRQGGTKRLRLAHGGWYWELKLQIDRHNMTIIEAAGTALAPVVVEQMVVAPAERYDVLVTADQPCGNYTIIWHSHAEDEHGYLGEAEGNFTAVLEYVDCYWYEPAGGSRNSSRGRRDSPAPGATAAHPKLPFAVSTLTSREWMSTKEIPTGLFRAAPTEPSPPAAADREIKFHVYPQPPTGLADDGIVWNFDNVTFASPTVPLYVTKGHYYVVNDGPERTTVVDIALGAVVDLIVCLQGVDMHSIHLHGNKFWVLAVGDLPYDAHTAVDNLVDPPLLDTVLLTTRTYLKLRFVADNPGMWHFHCHLLIHMQHGLQLSLIHI